MSQAGKAQEGQKNLISVASALTSLGDSAGNSPTHTSSPAHTLLQKDASINELADELSEKEDDDDHKASQNSRPKAELDVPMTFPQRLMEILSNEQHGDIIAWLPHGKGFMIYQKKRFENEIMPKYFKKSKYTSFTRKLNRWNFTRVTRGGETGAYYHEFFQRDNLQLCMRMFCQSSKPTGSEGGPPKINLPGGPSSVNLAMARMRLNKEEESLTMQGMQNFNQLSQQGMNMEPALGDISSPDNVHLLRLRQLQLEEQQQQRERQLLLQHQQQHQRQMAAIAMQQHQKLQGQPAQLGNHLGNSLGNNRMNALLAAQGPNVPMHPSGMMGANASDGNYGPSVFSAMHNIQRTNDAAYINMLMAQEKAQALAAASGGVPSLSQSELQAQFIQAQQRQLEAIAQQRRLMATANMQQQGFDPGMAAMGQMNFMHPGGMNPGGPQNQEPRGPKRASAA